MAFGIDFILRSALETVPVTVSVPPPCQMVSCGVFIVLSGHLGGFQFLAFSK